MLIQVLKLDSMKFKDFFNKTKLKDWFVANAETRKAKVALALVSFTESIFFPIPPDFFLMAILASNGGRRWAYYSLITSVFSVLGGIVSYLIGFLFFDALGQKIVNLYSLQEDFLKVQTLFQENAFLSVFVSSFTPLPDKIFNLVAGLFKINIFVFIFAYIIGRSLRFFGVGFAMKVFGSRVARAVYRHLNMASFGIILLILFVLFILFKIK